MTITRKRIPKQRETPTDEFTVLEVAFRSGDRERLRLALAHAESAKAQAALSFSERAELGDLISEAHKRLSMNGRA